MAYYRDFREYLEALEKRGKLTRIRRAINKDTELHPLVRLQFRGLPEDERKAFLFENVTDSNGKQYDIPVAVGALAGSSDIYSIGMMCEPDDIAEKLAQAEMHPLEPGLVKKGPVQEEVHAGDSLLEHGGLGEFPIPVTTPGYDASPYITAPYFVSRDPETGVPNVGMYRAMVKTPARTGIMLQNESQGLYIHWRKSQKRGVPLQAAIVIGGPPSLGYVSVAKMPIGVNELAVAGAIAGEPLELVKCRTVDLEVPASAEIVIEGEVSVTEVEPEGPFGEGLGFVGPVEIGPRFDVTCITHRKHPVWVATISQYPPSESSKIRQYSSAGTVYKHLRYTLKMANVLGVAFYDTLGSSRIIAIKLKNGEADAAWPALEAAANRYTLAKLIIAVNEDVNLRDFDSVMLAVCMRTQPHRDYRIQKVAVPSSMDLAIQPIEQWLAYREVSRMERPEGSRLLINATMRWPYPPLSLPKKEFMERALRIWQEEGLPELKLKEPWWGVNLGYWNEEVEDLAMSAVRGQHYKAGELYDQRRRPA